MRHLINATAFFLVISCSTRYTQTQLNNEHFKYDTICRLIWTDKDSFAAAATEVFDKPLQKIVKYGTVNFSTALFYNVRNNQSGSYNGTLVKLDSSFRIQKIYRFEGTLSTFRLDTLHISKSLREFSPSEYFQTSLFYSSQFYVTDGQTEFLACIDNADITSGILYKYCSTQFIGNEIFVENQFLDLLKFVRSIY